MYNKIRNLVYLKSGGKIPKMQSSWGTMNYNLQAPDLKTPGQYDGQIKQVGDKTYKWIAGINQWHLTNNTIASDPLPAAAQPASTVADEVTTTTGVDYETVDYDGTPEVNTGELFGQKAKDIAIQAGGAIVGELGGQTAAKGYKGLVDSAKMIKAGNSAGTAGVIGGAMMAASGMAEEQMLGDKNFSGTSEKVDSMVHGISGAIAGIVPWGTLAAGIMEGVNVATKAGGSTVEGYDVNIASSGYSQDLQHLDALASRGLFGIDFANTSERLLKRNRDLKMALDAATNAEENMFQQEARMNSIQNTLMNNQIALQGGLQTNMLSD